MSHTDTVCSACESADVELRIDGTLTPIYRASCADFAKFTLDKESDIVLTFPEEPESATVRPVSKGIDAAVNGREVRLRLAPATCVQVDIGTGRELFLFAVSPDIATPDASGPKVRRLAAGSVHELGQVELASGDTLVIEPGAVLRGSIHAADAHDITVCGGGIVDGSYWRERGERRRGMLFERCTNVTVEGITVINPTGWTHAHYGCEDVTIRHIQEISEGNGSDGIDILSCRRARVGDCFLRNGDDCLVVKAMPERVGEGSDGAVEDVLFERCTMLNVGAGSAMEIGHELKTDEVRNITFRDCDVLGVHGHGSVFGIHNAGNATVRDVLFDDIRVEHFFTYLISFRIIESRYSRIPERGRIRNVHLKNIAVTAGRMNQGYSASLIGGYDAEHTIEGVTIENLRIDGRRIGSADELDLYCRNAGGVRFG
ncbi:MAG: hypothetical protein GF331_18635 [Chitinivibrionales bacterium]|nr:hypothetical protein [Chitinivibrionales bacterium]